MSRSWLRVLDGRDPAPDDALAAAALVAGAAHRLAWAGPDPAGDRRRAVGWLRAATGFLAEPHPGLSAVLDWWLVAALDEEPVQLAWSVDREIPAPTGGALLDILKSAGRARLERVRRPALFKQVLEQLTVTANRNPGKIAAEKDVIGPVLGECKTVVRAAIEGHPPPRDVAVASLTDHDIEVMTTARTSGGRGVIPGTPVHGTLIRRITEARDLVRRALRLWPTDDEPPIPLPASWKRDLQKATGDAAELAVALVSDALPEPGEHAVLSPARALERLADAEGRAFFVVREAARTLERPLPGWAAAIQERLDAFEDQLSTRRSYGAPAAALLEEARAHLESLDFDGAAEWMRAADEEQGRAAADADLERRRTLARDRVAQLAAVGADVPEEAGDPYTWVNAVEQRWNEARAKLQERANRATDRATLLTWTDELEQAHQRLRQALARGELPPLAQALEQVEALVGEVRQDEERRLGPELVALRDRIGRLPSGPARAGLTEGLGRATLRRQAGLPWAPLVTDLGLLADRLARDPDSVAAVAVDDARGRARRVGWALGGVRAEGDEPRQSVVRIHGVRLTPGIPSDAAKRLAGWGMVHPTPPAAAEGRVFLVEGEGVVGPFRVSDGRGRPEHPSGAVARLDAERFEALFGRIDVGQGRWLVPQAPSLEELVAVGGEVRDLLDAELAAEALARRLDAAVPPEVIAEWIRSLGTDGLPEPIRRARLERLGALLAEAQALAAHRDAAVRAWLDSPAGRDAIARAADARVERETDRIRTQVEQRREALEAELEPLRARLEALRAEIAAADELLGDRKLRLLAELGSARPAAADPPAPRVAAQPIRASRFEATALGDVRALVRTLAGRTWPEEQTANLLLSLATGRWTLLAGLPGVGKSTFVRSVLTRLGHGPGTERYLELVVRRDWQDDAALFGFWHPTERIWTPSSEGFVEHLLRAADDERQGHDGVWPVLVEELNLASPEYYLARPISAFEAADPTIRLYDPDLAPANRDRYPPAFRVPDSVRLLATVNVDDTVERLSPRFLSRASVLWIEPRPDAPLWSAADDVTPCRVRWKELRARVEAGAASLGRIDAVARFLQDARVPGAPTARTRVAIGRYLAASEGVLDRAAAEDLQILQRVLPPLRGVGPAWRELLERLTDLLDAHGWPRSARRAAELRVRGEALGDWYDFFHT